MYRQLALCAVVATAFGCRPAPCGEGCTRVGATHTDIIREVTRVECKAAGDRVSGKAYHSCQSKPFARVLSRGVCKAEKRNGDYVCKRAGECVVQEDISTFGWECECPKEQLLSTRVRFQKWPVLDKAVVGLIFTSPDDDRRSIDWMRGFTTHDTYWFSVNGLSPQVLYWPASSPDQGVNYLSNWQVQTKDEGVVRYNASMFGPNMRRRLTGSAHIVRLQINDGAGSSRNIHFVATRTRVLDGRLGVPSNPGAVLDEMWDQAEAYFGSLELSEQLAAAEEKLNPGGEHSVSTQAPRTGFAPSWMMNEQCLRATFITDRRKLLTGPRLPCNGGPLLPTAAGVRPPPFCPPPQTYPFGVQAGIVLEACGGQEVRVVEQIASKVYSSPSLPLQPTTDAPITIFPLPTTPVTIFPLPKQPVPEV